MLGGAAAGGTGSVGGPTTTRLVGVLVGVAVGVVMVPPPPHVASSAGIEPSGQTSAVGVDVVVGVGAGPHSLPGAIGPIGHGVVEGDTDGVTVGAPLGETVGVGACDVGALDGEPVDVGGCVDGVSVGAVLGVVLGVALGLHVASGDLVG